MSPTIAFALVLALASTTLVNTAYLREHAAASRLPPLSPRRPIASLRALLGDRGWLGAFAMESGGFALYVAALALAPLALVQSVGAGGIGLLAVGSARIGGRPLSRRESAGTITSIVGLLFLALSLIDGGAHSGRGSALEIAVWLAATAALAGLVLAGSARLLSPGAACGIAGGLLFAIGDISTKVATQGGARIVFAVTLIAGYTLGTSLLQIGYQRGAALSVAGVATLLTNALPIAAGTVLLHEGIPTGALGVLRVLAFATVVAGAIMLARPERAPVVEPLLRPG
ncbi:MAG TPA: hypothetical protein VN772_03510 [Solirubrobacteraceae bacterium]|nr:hypothetical protein [Solirubrobacteraceae bacterium]